MSMNKRTGIYCPYCDRQGINNSELLVLQGGFKSADGARMYECTVQHHRVEHDALMKAGPRMMKLRITEKQPGGTQAWPVWVFPQVLQRLQEKYPNNLMTTICSLLTALASDSTIIIEGEYAVEMKQLAQQNNIQLVRGRDFLGLLQTNIALSKQMEEVRIQQKALEPMLKMLGMAGQALQAGQNPMAAVIAGQQQQEAALDLPPRATQAAPIQHNEFGEGFDADGNYIETGEEAGQQGPQEFYQPNLTPAPQQPQPQPAVQFASSGAAPRPGGLPVPTPQRER